ARDLPEPVQGTGRIAQRRDDDVRPEPRTVLADAPAFVLETAFLGRDAQRALGLSREGVLAWVEGGEMMPDDVRRLVALDPLRALVPGHDVPGRIEKEDGVVDDGVDEHREALAIESAIGECRAV